MAKPNSPTPWMEIQRKATDSSYREQLAEKEKLIKGYAKALAGVERERDVALSLKEEDVAPRAIPMPSGDKAEATAFTIWGDWHAEETIDPKTISGLNEFNLEVCERRINKLVRSTLRLTEIERSGATIKNLVVGMLGDMMTGYIHEELQESNGLSPTETILWLRNRIVSALKLLKKEGGFERIIIPCCYGNHGRTTKKPRHATGAKNSYEWMMYHVMKDDLPEMEWHIADGYHLYLDVYDRTIRFHHGDNVQYQGGIGGLTIPTEKAIAKWNTGKTPYLDIFGHHHTAQQNPRWMCNGSLVGFGAYSLSIKAGYELPQQTFFLLDSKRGRTATWPIFLE